MNEQNFFRVSVKGIVVDEQGRFLLAREKNGMWDMLGGGLDHEEDPLEGLRREVLEETGLKVTWISPTPKYFITGPSFGGNGVYVANAIYEMKLESLDFKSTEECEEVRFFSPEEARAVELFPTVRKLIELFDHELHAAAHIG